MDVHSPKNGIFIGIDPYPNHPNHREVLKQGASMLRSCHMLSPHHRKFARKLASPTIQELQTIFSASFQHSQNHHRWWCILKKQDMWRKRYFLATLCSLETCGCSGYSCCHCGRSGHRLAILITLDNLDILEKSEPCTRTFSIFGIVFVGLDTHTHTIMRPYTSLAAWRAKWVSSAWREEATLTSLTPVLL